MLQRYRILNAILTLREFTVADIARYSGVKDTTVRTVLGRETRFVERDGIRATAGRGGQPIQYRLRTDAEQDLTNILRQLEDVGVSLPPLVEDQEDPVMLSLIAAEDILLRQVPRAADADRAGLLDLAIADYEAVQLHVDAHGNREAATHSRVVRLLLDLTAVEQEVLALERPASDPGRSTQSIVMLGNESEKKLEALGREWRNLLQSWPTLSDRELLPDLVHRVGTSRIGSTILTSAGETRETGHPV